MDRQSGLLALGLTLVAANAITSGMYGTMRGAVTSNKGANVTGTSGSPDTSVLANLLNLAQNKPVKTGNSFWDFVFNPFHRFGP